MKHANGRSWFSRRGAQRNFERHLLPMRHKRFAYLEFGVWQGHSLRWVAEHMQPRVAVGVDPWAPMRKRDRGFMDEIHRAASIALAGYPRVKLFRTYSSVWLREQRKPERFHVIYVDGDHFGPSVLTDAVLAWPLLKPGGLMIFDDYALGRKRSGVADAVDCFRIVYRPYCAVEFQNYQIGLRKTRRTDMSVLDHLGVPM